jgi:heptaprenyl diphosphate synthase
MNKFWNAYPDLALELEGVNSIINEHLKCKEKFFEESVGQMVASGGKMIRPAFLLLASKFGCVDKDKLHSLAAAIEMLHLATLVHDDIIDDSKLRRGRETIQHEYGKEYAVYAGDFLFARCLMVLSKHEYTSENMHEVSRVMSKICMGEVKQYQLRYVHDVDIRNYLRVVSGKTATLIAMSLYVGASESGCSEKLSKKLGRIGYNIGMAFQVIDDLLDYQGDSALLGKSALKDIQKGYYTLPLIFAMRNDPNQEISKRLAKERLDDDSVREIVDLVKKNKGIDKARGIADRYTQKAFNQIEQLPDCESKKIIKEVTGILLGRNY